MTCDPGGFVLAKGIWSVAKAQADQPMVLIRQAGRTGRLGSWLPILAILIKALFDFPHRISRICAANRSSRQRGVVSPRQSPAPVPSGVQLICVKA